jgi:putative holliday junction resolvase
VRALGLDVGSKTIGVAVSDELGFAAHPRQTLVRRGERADVEQVAEVARAEGVEAIVIGLPLELSGRAGHRAQRVKRFAAALAEQLGPSMPIHEWDERFSTAAAERVLLEGNVSRKRRKQVVDKQAAAYILQGWLDGRRPAGVSFSGDDDESAD